MKIRRKLLNFWLCKYEAVSNHLKKFENNINQSTIIINIYQIKFLCFSGANNGKFCFVDDLNFSCTDRHCFAFKAPHFLLELVQGFLNVNWVNSKGCYYGGQKARRTISPEKSEKLKCWKESPLKTRRKVINTSVG